MANPTSPDRLKQNFVTAEGLHWGFLSMLKGYFKARFQLTR